jgi:lycopene beta-cyclase
MTAAKLKPNVHWVEAAISNITETNVDNTHKEVLLEWEGGFAKGKMVFTSILPFQMNNLLSATKYDSVNKSATHLPFLWQHFKGRTVTFNQPVFNQKVARLMDFNVPQHGATAFMYLLPINEMQALVEYTLFSEKILEIPMYDRVLNDYLAKHYPDCIYTIEHEEIGAIPMTHQSFSNFEAPIYSIGALGLAIKASTGYAFQFIQQQCKNIVVQLEQGATIQTNVHNTRHRFYDAVLLHVLFYHKMEGSEIFKRIFAKNKAATVFKFLSNTSNLLEDIQIMRSLPTRIFLPAAIAVLCRRG